jgi:DNA-binding MarR family transcriptional regulator
VPRPHPPAAAPTSYPPPADPAGRAAAVSPSAALGAEVMSVSGALRRLTRRRLRAGHPGPAPIRGTRLELLQLVEAEQGIGIAAAARALHLAGNSVSTMVNQLVDGGWLRREVDPADRRAARLRLTDRARERLSVWRAARGELLGSALERLPEADRRAVAEALPALRRLLVELEAGGRDAAVPREQSGNRRTSVEARS